MLTHDRHYTVGLVTFKLQCKLYIVNALLNCFLCLSLYWSSIRGHEHRPESIAAHRAIGTKVHTHIMRSIGPPGYLNKQPEQSGRVERNELSEARQGNLFNVCPSHVFNFEFDRFSAGKFQVERLFGGRNVEPA